MCQLQSQRLFGTDQGQGMHRLVWQSLNRQVVSHPLAAVGYTPGAGVYAFLQCATILQYS